MLMLGLFTLLAGALLPTSAHAQFPPMPRILHEYDSVGFSEADFQRVLSQLKVERDGLDADWKSMTKRLNTRPPTAEPDLEKLEERINRVLTTVRERVTPSPAGPAQPAPIKIENPPSENKKKPDERLAPVVPDASSITPALGPVDVVHLGQTLFRAERYEEALAAFRKVDLLGKKPEERAPIIYFTAACLHHLGKTEEGIALLREVANSRGDERVAGYAQWQIENLRWHRETQAKLQEIRRRLQTMEKP
jgi:tetratricopeptide (TPR) repeat protein